MRIPKTFFVTLHLRIVPPPWLIGVSFSLVLNSSVHKFWDCEKILNYILSIYNFIKLYVNLTMTCCKFIFVFGNLLKIRYHLHFREYSVPKTGETVFSAIYWNQMTQRTNIEKWSEAVSSLNYNSKKLLVFKTSSKTSLFPIKKPELLQNWNTYGMLYGVTLERKLKIEKN